MAPVTGPAQTQADGTFFVDQNLPGGRVAKPAAPEPKDETSQIKVYSAPRANLSQVEKNKDADAGGANLPQGKVISLSEQRQAQSAALWKEPNLAEGEAGGSIHRRLTEGYGFSPQQVTALRSQYLGMNQGELDKKIPPLSTADKGDRLKVAMGRQKIESEAMQSMLKDKSKQLGDKLNQGKHPEKDGTYVKSFDAESMVAQKFREQGVDVNAKPVDYFKAKAVEGNVDAWQKELPRPAKDGLKDAAVAPTYEKALGYEKDETLKTLTPLMPGNTKDKKSNAQLYLAEQSQLKSPADFQAYRQQLSQETHRVGGRVSEGERRFKEKAVAWKRDLDSPSGAERNKALRLKAGVDDELGQLTNDQVKGLTKKQAGELRAQTANKAIDDKFRNNDREKNWEVRNREIAINAKNQEIQDKRQHELQKLRAVFDQKINQQNNVQQNILQDSSNAKNTLGYQTLQHGLTKAVDSTAAKVDQQLEMSKELMRLALGKVFDSSGPRSRS